MLIGIGDKAIEIRGFRCRVLRRVKVGWLNPGVGQCNSCGSLWEGCVHMCMGDGEKFTVTNIPIEKWPMGCDMVVDDEGVKIYAPEVGGKHQHRVGS